MPVVTETLIDAAGGASRQAVAVDVADPSTGKPVRAVYAESATVVSRAVAFTDDTGTWSVVLAPNDGLLPSGTVYRVTVDGLARYITVPDVPGPCEVVDLLVDGPGDTPLEPAQYAALVAQIAATVPLPAGAGQVGQVLSIASLDPLTTAWVDAAPN